jgi:hypothetical protein
MAAPLRQLLYCSPFMAAPLQHSMADHYGSFSTAAPQRQPIGFGPLTPSQSLCDVKPLQPTQLWTVLQLGCSYFFSVAPTATVLPLLPSCSPCRHRESPAAVQRSFRDVKPLQPPQLAGSSAGVQLSLPSSPCRHHAAPAAVKWSFCDIKPLQPRELVCSSAGVQLLSYFFPAAPATILWPCHHHATLLPSCDPAAIMRPLPPSCGPCHHHAAPAAVQRSSCDVKPLQPLQIQS